MFLKKNNLLLQITAGLLLLVFTAAHAQEINWYTTDQGGGTSSNGDTELTGVIGQVETKRMEGGSITISGGYFPFPADLIFENKFDG